MLLADGFNEAFVGTAHRSGMDQPVAAYDREKCIEILMRDGGTRNDAEEFFEYNVAGAWVGEQTPIFIELRPLGEVVDLSSVEGK